MLRMLVAYDADGNVIATLDHMVARDEEGNVIGLVDFEAHESNGGQLTDIWNVSGAVGSGTWPEWLGAAAIDFKAEVDPATKKITALVHKHGGHRRNRAEIEEAIKKRVDEANGGPADIRDLVGGPDRPLVLDEKGKAKRRPASRPSLHVIGRRD